MEVKTPEKEVVNTDQMTPEVVNTEETNDEMESASDVAQEAATQNGEWIEYANKYNPGADTSTPQAILDALLPTFQKMVVTEGEFIDLIKESPEAGAVLLDWKETGSLPIAIARNYDPEEISALVEEINDEAYEEHRNAFSEKVKAGKAREEMVRKNLEVSLKDISEFQEENKGWSPEKSQAFEDFVIKIYDDGADGLIPKAYLKFFEKGFVFDEKMAEKDMQIAEAEENGMVAGRNAARQTEKMTKKDIASILPETSGGGAMAIKEDKKPKSFGANFMKGVFD